MDKITGIIITFSLVILQSCVVDQTKNLGSGYTFRDEGGSMKEIYHDFPNIGGQVPATIVSFDYDKDFIIAKQQPKLPQNPLYERQFEYNNGENSFYYWLVNKKKHIVIGPLDSTSFFKIKKELKVSEKLSLE